MFKSYWVAVYIRRMNFSKTKFQDVGRLFFVKQFGHRCTVDDTGSKLTPASLLPMIIDRRCPLYWQKINRWCHGIDVNLEQGVTADVNNNTGNNLSLVMTTPEIIRCTARKIPIKYSADEI